MADISLKRPINLSFNLVDWDSTLPSLNVQVDISSKPDMASAFQLKLASVWFFCRVWNEFTTSLLSGQTATLTDMDRKLTIQVTSIIEGSKLIITYRAEQYQDDFDTNIELIAKLDQDSVSIWKEQFKNLPKWW
ncbi:hypothetical protein GCM10028773_25080 [Spirosoma koreense]